jgi:hypothetical protein
MSKLTKRVRLLKVKTSGDGATPAERGPLVREHLIEEDEHGRCRVTFLGEKLLSEP